MQYTIKSETQELYPELISLLLATESMDNSEKQYWFDILPSLSREDVSKLFDILETERKKLEELEVKYEALLSNM